MPAARLVLSKGVSLEKLTETGLVPPVRCGSRPGTVIRLAATGLTAGPCWQ